jgi:(1->4)-alpha-D-glucan 1-alpha-D-glucosylmutase
MLKALKEGKVNSSWIDPNEDWEIAVASFIKKILDESDGAAFQEDFLKTLELVLAPGLWNSLSQTVLKCTAPGVPDIYQGTELWDLSLVDPDNRRPVDYAIRRQLLAETSDPSEMIADWRNGKIKLHVLKSLLRFRREHAAFFRSSDYQPVPVIGARANHAVAFLRSHGTEQLLVITCRLTAALGSRPLQETWSETTIALPSGSRGTWHNLLTAENTVIERDQPELSGLLVSFPFAVLHRSVKS